MSKLFEIPIYAFSPGQHQQRLSRYKASLQQAYENTHGRGNTSKMNEWIYLVCHPFQLWDYNHIVGYIVISFDKADINFDLFLQAQGQYNKTRYQWRTTQKWLLESQRVGGWHFRLEEIDPNETIKSKIESLLDGMIRELVPQKYYVDKEAFSTMNRLADYTRLMKGK